MDLEERVARLESMVGGMDEKLNIVLEQVTLGKHIVAFAKMMGWVIGVCAAVVETYRALKGN